MVSSHADTIRHAIYANGPQKWDDPILALDALLAENQRLRDAAREVLDYENQPSRAALSKLRTALDGTPSAAQTLEETK